MRRRRRRGRGRLALRRRRSQLGSVASASSPPPARLRSTTSPPCARRMLRAIGNPEPDAAGFPVAARFQAAEGLEHRFQLRWRDARPLILHGEAEPLALRRVRRGEAEPRRATVAQRVVHQVGDRALQRHRPSLRHHQPLRPRIGNALRRLRPARIRRLVEHGAAERREVERHRGLGGRLVAGEGEGRRDHRFHLVEVGQHPPPLLLVLQELGAEAEAGDRRAEVMADRRQHLRAVADEAADAPGHGVEGAGGGGDLRWSLLWQGRRVHVAPEPLRRLRQVAHRPRQPPHRPERERRRGRRHHDEGEQEGLGMPGSRPRQLHPQVQPLLPFRQSERDGEFERPPEPGNAHLARPEARRPDGSDLIQPEQPHRGHRRRRHARFHERIVVEGRAQAGRQLRIRQHRRPPVGRRRQHRAPQPEGARRDLARKGEALQVHAVQRVDQQPRALRQGQRQQEHQRRPAREAPRPQAPRDRGRRRRQPPRSTLAAST